MEKRRIDEHTIFRFAGEQDTALILQFIRELAEYEKMEDQVSATEDLLKKTIFTDRKAEVIICEYDSHPAGFMLFFHNYSTFLGKPGIYIEDLYVKPFLRGKGLGGKLLSYAAELALERGCGRLEWSCLDWNEPSISFYKKKGAVPMDEWTVYRVSGEGLKKLAENGQTAGV
ncbi:GNAT family N-acetyltransferase [Breznakiella homolactica]|uniref:GNAT family N-acetyltransferase n=1 Tax=Breznakiella homolactica TaxID=2798577 RepID=A0A7T8BAQ8_9SPIR|nr:GNAT family N-acetyltransferase [Breznakiella homolactica]QQO09651.1 GNAT family N-acetyltransferase [Breznakiella homolactica]